MLSQKWGRWRGREARHVNYRLVAGAGREGQGEGGKQTTHMLTTVALLGLEARCWEGRARGREKGGKQTKHMLTTVSLQELGVRSWEGETRWWGQKSNAHANYCRVAGLGARCWEGRARGGREASKQHTC